MLALDVTDRRQHRQAIADGVAAFGAIDVLVNNAGIGLASIVEATPDSTMREIFETNTFGVIATCRAIIPQMRKQGHGVIVNVTSSVAIGVMPLVAVYAASKCAVEGFTKSLSYELEQFDIKARLVEPGYAPTTNFTANGGAAHAGPDPGRLRILRAVLLREDGALIPRTPRKKIGHWAAGSRLSKDGASRSAWEVRSVPKGASLMRKRTRILINYRRAKPGRVGSSHPSGIAPPGRSLALASTLPVTGEG